MSHHTEQGAHTPIDDIKIGSVSFEPNGIPITAVFGGKNVGAPARGFQIVPTGYGIITLNNFAQFLGSAFALSVPIDPEKIPFNPVTPSKADKDLARQLGYTVVPMASVRVTEAGYLEAWIGPTLVRQGSELAVPRDNNHLHIIRAKKAPTIQTGISNILLPERRVVTAHFLHFSVPDQPVVLAEAEVVERIKNQGIDVFGLLQSKDRQNHQASIAFLLNPCKTGSIRAAVDAIAAIKQFSSDLHINSLFRVLGNPGRQV